MARKIAKMIKLLPLLSYKDDVVYEIEALKRFDFENYCNLWILL